MMKNSSNISQVRTVRGLWAALRLRLILAKAPKSFLISISAVFAYVIKTADIKFSMILTGCSVFALACGAATFNNYQDRHLDFQMQRTRQRPLPSGKISARQTMGQAIFLMALGLAGLYQIDNSLRLPLLGAAAIVSYNFIYTPLKTKSMLAILPGAVCGMLPPCIGWLAAGGKIESTTLWSIMALFGLWQLPHFWLILLLHPQDYLDSNMPNLLNIFTVAQVRKVLFHWVMVFAVMSFSLPLANVVVTDMVHWLLALNAVVLVSHFAYQFFVKTAPYNYKTLLVHLNAALILMMGLGALDRLILFYPRWL